MPLFGQRVFSLRIPGAPTGGAFGKNQVICHDEILTTEIGKVGTQFDGLGHIGARVGKAGELDNEVFYAASPQKTCRTAKARVSQRLAPMA